MHPTRGTLPESQAKLILENISASTRTGRLVGPIRPLYKQKSRYSIEFIKKVSTIGKAVSPSDVTICDLGVEGPTRLCHRSHCYVDINSKVPVECPSIEGRRRQGTAKCNCFGLRGNNNSRPK